MSFAAAQPPLDPARREPVRVLVVDADRRVRSSLNALISLADGFRMVRAVATPDDAFVVLATEPVDVVLIDPRLPDLEVGLAFVAEAHRTWPALALVTMSCFDDVARHALHAGVVAFVAKSGQPDMILATLARSASSHAARRPVAPERPPLA
jgi:DNA-binding NarL/FixJ family response regulator